jgi:hypothetical protein
MSATHIAIASGASMPDRRAMLSHFAAWVLRRSMTRSKSNMVASGVGSLRRRGEEEGRLGHRLAAQHRAFGTPHQSRNVLHAGR